MPGVISGVGVGDGFGRAGRRVVGARRVVRFLCVVLGFGFAAGILLMSCPSCCGSANPLIISISAHTNTVRDRLRP